MPAEIQFRQNRVPKFKVILEFDLDNCAMTRYTQRFPADGPRPPWNKEINGNRFRKKIHAWIDEWLHPDKK